MSRRNRPGQTPTGPDRSGPALTGPATTSSRPTRSAPPRVRRRRRIAAPADVVWRHVTGATWLGLDDDDPRTGDRIRLHDPFGGGGPRQARVLEARPGRSLTLEWWPDDRPDDRSVVAISLAPSGGATTVTVVERALPHTDVVARGRVWSSCLQALAGAAERTRSPFALSVS